MKLTKRIFSGLLAAMMLFTTAFAVNDSATTKAANALTFAFKPITGSEYDSTALQTDLAAAQKIISQRMQLEGLTGASAAVSGDVITVSIPKTATGNTAAYWAARLGDRRLCSVTDFLNEEWQFDRADFASAKATTENGAEAVEIDLTDSGKTKLTEAHNKVKAYLADSKNDADKAQWLTFHWGTTTFRMLVDDSFSDSKLVIGGDSDPLRAGASKYMPQYLMLDPLPFALEQTAVPTTTKPTTPTTPTTPTEPTTPTDPTTPSEPTTTDFPDIDGHWAAASLRKGVELGLLKGINGKIMPNNSVKRSEAIVILNRALGATQADLGPAAAAVREREDLGKAIHLGLITANDNRSFDTAATRAEAFVLMARAFAYDRAETAADELSSFTDTSSMTTEQKQAAAALIGQGVVNGTSAAKLSPSNKLTRAQFVTMIVRIAAATNADSAPTELAGGT
ncbi:MAG: S-layer homology domain-containing protein, partial [Butyricicoccaceae bacterium]